jgi:hypothetical protein
MGFDPLMIGGKCTWVRGEALRLGPAAIPAEVGQTCITSPPYLGLRDYGCFVPQNPDPWKELAAHQPQGSA